MVYTVGLYTRIDTINLFSMVHLHGWISFSRRIGENLQTESVLSVLKWFCSVISRKIDRSVPHFESQQQST